MSKERQKARAAREAARATAVEAAARQRARRETLRGLRPTLPALPRSRRRYGALPPRARLQLLAVFLVVQAVAWQFLDGVGVRGSFAVLTAAVLAVLAATRNRTTRRRKPR